VRLKDLGRWYSGGTPPRSDEHAWEGPVPWVSAKDVDSSRLREFTTFITEEAAARHSRTIPSGSLLLIVRGMALAHGLPVVRTTERVAFNQDLRGLVPYEEYESRFLYYALLGARWRLDAHIDRAAHGTARVPDSLYSERISVPEPDSQRAIADFLDRESARIHELQQELQTMADDVAAHDLEVVERRLAVLRARYPTRKLAWDVAVLGGFAFKSAEFAHDPEAGVRLLRGTNVTPDGTRWEDVVYWPHERYAEAARFALRGGDLVVGLNRPWVRDRLRCAIITEADLPALLLQRVAVLRMREPTLIAPYVRLWLQTRDFRQVAGDASAVTFPMLEPDRMMAYRVPRPPVEVQEQLVREATDEAACRRDLDEETRGLMSALSEYRGALITEAVTGQFDVRRVSDAQMDDRLHEAIKTTERAA
jgi:restriction endonuclease S subunit